MTFIQIYVVHGQIFQFSHLTSLVSLFPFFVEERTPTSFWIQKCDGDLNQKMSYFRIRQFTPKIFGKKIILIIRLCNFEKTQVPLREMNR